MDLPPSHQQHFAPNPFFSETVLKKEYKYIPPGDAAVNQPDQDGVSDALINFDLKRDTEPSVSASGRCR